MTRGWGVVELLHKTLPHWIPKVFSVVTQLGDAWLFFVLGALLYWYTDDRDTFGFLLGATLGALSLTLALKGFFALARPPEAIRFAEATRIRIPERSRARFDRVLVPPRALARPLVPKQRDSRPRASSSRSSASRVSSSASTSRSTWWPASASDSSISPS